MSNNEKLRRAKLIANPAAGDMHEATAKLEQVTRYLWDYGIHADVALAQPTRESIPIAKKAIKKGYPIVIAMGGDGTIGAVIRGIAKSKVHLGIIPAGTENDIARSLGIPEDLKEACALIASDHTRELDLGQISTKKRKKFYFFMISTVGVISTIYPSVKEVPHGDLSKLKDAIKTLLHFKSNPKVFLTLDGEHKIKVETMLVTVANTPLAGAKNLLAPDASLEDGLLDVAVYPGFSKAELLAYFAKTVHERLAEDGKIKTSPKLDIAAEGIPIGKGKAKIKLLPRALRVIAPEVVAGAEKPQMEILKELPVAVAVGAENHSNNGHS